MFEIWGSLKRLFAECAEKGEPVSCVLHFAALKAVGESVSHPLRYYDVNGRDLNLLAAMHAAEIRKMVFSSSATVYRPASDCLIRNSTQSDRRILMAKPRRWWSRYCEIIVKPTVISPASPCGISIRLSPWQRTNRRSAPGIPNNLFPYITRAAIGSLPVLPVLGRIIQPSMAAVCATTSTFRTWPLGMSRRLTGLLKTMFAVFIPSIWVPAEARRCCS